MEMTYKKMLEAARKDGKASEKIMWESIESASDMLSAMAESHPDLYWDFMREQHGIMYGRHYGKDFADYDVASLTYTDRDGKQKEGAHWSIDEINAATSRHDFEAGTTFWDKYVAFNAAYSDFCKNFTDDQIIQIGYNLFFADEDWPTSTKVWDYFCAKSKLE